MKKILFSLFASFLFVSLNASAEPTAKPATETAVQQSVVKLNGVVSDKITQETLAGAVITANGQKVYTDLEGNFTLPKLCGDKCQLKISMISYQDEIIDVDMSKSQTVQIKLQQR